MTDINYNNRLERQNSAIDLTLLKDAKNQKNTKLYNETFLRVLEKSKNGDESARDNLIEMRQKKSMFSGEDLLQLVISNAKNLDPTNDQQQDFLGPIMSIANIFINQENGEINKQGNNTLQNIEKMIATQSIGEEKLFATDIFHYNDRSSNKIIIDSPFDAEEIRAEISEYNLNNTKEKIITSIEIGKISKGKNNISEKIFSDTTKSKLKTNNYKISFFNKDGKEINLNPQISQKLESYNFQERMIETEGGLIRNFSEIIK